MQFHVSRDDKLSAFPAPYGIREATEKTETKCRRPATRDISNMPHFPSTSHYNLAHLYGDLLKFAAKHLRMGGRLVCWIPIYKFVHLFRTPIAHCDFHSILIPNLQS